MININLIKDTTSKYSDDAIKITKDSNFTNEQIVQINN